VQDGRQSLRVRDSFSGVVAGRYSIIRVRPPYRERDALQQYSAAGYSHYTVLSGKKVGGGEMMPFIVGLRWGPRIGAACPETSNARRYFTSVKKRNSTQ
jgi:hypothetical protein